VFCEFVLYVERVFSARHGSAAAAVQYGRQGWRRELCSDSSAIRSRGTNLPIAVNCNLTQPPVASPRSPLLCPLPLPSAQHCAGWGDQPPHPAPQQPPPPPRGGARAPSLDASRSARTPRAVTGGRRLATPLVAGKWGGGGRVGGRVGGGGEHRGVLPTERDVHHVRVPRGVAHGAREVFVRFVVALG